MTKKLVVKKTLDLSTKQQALEVIPQICEFFKIDPLEMLLAWTLHEVKEKSVPLTKKKVRGIK